MAARLGETLVEHALSPLRETGEALAANRVTEGLEQIVPPRLEAALRRGVEAIAKRAGVKPRVIDELLPRADMADALERLRAAQEVAVAAWKQHAGGMGTGGLLTGVGEVTAEAEVPDVGWYLARLAGKLVRDKRLSAPLDSLAVEVTAWQELVLSAGRTLDASRRLSRSFWIRLARVAVLMATLAVALVWLLEVQLARRAAKARVDAALGSADACAVLGLAPDDLRRAGEELAKRVAERGQQCEAQQARARHDAACQALVAHVAAGKLAPEDDALAPAVMRPLLGRIASGTLETADLTLAADGLAAVSCPGHVDELWSAFARAAARATHAWATATTVSTHVKARIAAQGGLSADARQVLVDLSEASAKRAVYKGDDESIEEGKRLCALAGEVGIKGEKWCTALGVALQKRAR